MLSMSTMNKEITWTVHGINWDYQVLGNQDTCPLEISTRAVELIWNSDDSELWKGLDSEREHLNVKEEVEPGLGIVVIVKNSEMQSQEDHLVVSSPIVLANAGLHSEAARIQKEWDKVTEEDKLASLLRYLQNDKNDD